MRNYELSLWTLQDSFITILELPDIKSKGKTHDPSMTLNVDGTQSLTFSIPMYYSVNGEKYYNPAWYNNIKGNLLINTRKIKVIFNKKTDKEEIYEFVIDKITERHEGDELYCDVECSGLAFYELGKIGYKISLSSEDFYAKDLEWFQGAQTTEQPLANIQFWLDQFLSPVPNGTLEPNTWYYKIQMDWSAYANQPMFPRSSSKIYEDADTYNAFITAQTDIAHAGVGQIYLNNRVIYKEKARLVDLEESNIYNLTQNLAEVFGVYCKYVYTYDKNYHIIGRTIVFYNNFLYEEDKLSLTYHAQTSSITRDMDSTDLITKMYVRTVDSDNDLISILDVEENYSKEDYLLNFDYLHTIGTINDETYAYISEYEQKIRNINIQLKPIYESIAKLEEDRIEVEAKQTVANNAIQLDQERIAAVDELLNNITNNTGTIPISASAPDFAILIQDSNTGLYYFNVPRKGILPQTLKIYNKINSNTDKAARLLESNRITNFKLVYDEYGNLIQVTNIPYSSGSKKVYLVYTYEPKLYDENIKRAWQIRAWKDTMDHYKYTNDLIQIDSQLETLNTQKNTLLNSKKQEIAYFEKLMGSALREGYWQPENYDDYGDIYNINYKVTDSGTKIIGETNYDSFLWDTERFSEESDIKYELGATQSIEYYPCIDLSSIWNSIKNNLNNLSFLFYDYTDSTQYPHTLKNIKAYAFNSQAILAFVKVSNTIKPVLLLVGATNLSSETLNIVKSNTDNKIGQLSVTISGTSTSYSISSSVSVTSDMWIDLNSSYKIVFPRIKIETSGLKVNEEQLALKYGGVNLKNYEDYYLNTRIEASEHSSYNGSALTLSSYFITIKPHIIMQQQFDKTLSILFTISNADTSIYRDAKLILKENSQPKVEYNVDYNIFKLEMIEQPSHYLNHIVNINDYELHFNNVRGYISELTLNLDHPWEDSVEIKNYKSKFEDLFSTILAQTESMKKNEFITDTVSSAFTSNGELTSNIMQETLQNTNLNYSFNNGKLTINEEEGIWGASDNGVVAFRGGGIFTATEKDSSGNWKWTTGITPEGINANHVSFGQLDTSKIKIFAGDKVRMQMNEDGLFAYKSYYSDLDIISRSSFNSTQRNEAMSYINNTSDIDGSQYVKFCEEGLFLIAKNGAKVLDEDSDQYITVTLNDAEEVERVAISWRGLVLRNYEGERTFYANATTGDLIIKGTMIANSGQIGPWNIGEECIYKNYASLNTPVEFGSSDGIYFGNQGLSLFGLFNVEVGEVQNQQRFKEFIIKNRADNDDDYMVKISLDEINNRYEFNLKQVLFGDDVKTTLQSVNTSRLKRQFIMQDGSSNVVIQENATTGDLILLYKNKNFNGSISTYSNYSSSNYENVCGITNIKYWNNTASGNYIIGAELSQTEAYGYYKRFYISSSSSSLQGYICFCYTPVGSVEGDYIIKLFDNENNVIFTKKETLSTILAAPVEEVQVELGDETTSSSSYYSSTETDKRYILIPANILKSGSSNIYRLVFYSSIPGTYMTISSPNVMAVTSGSGNGYLRLYAVTSNTGSDIYYRLLYSDGNEIPTGLKRFVI